MTTLGAIKLGDFALKAGQALTLTHAEGIKAPRLVLGASGKTTLAKLLCRLYDPTGGLDVEVHDHDALIPHAMQGGTRYDQEGADVFDVYSQSGRISIGGRPYREW